MDAASPFCNFFSLAAKLHTDIDNGRDMLFATHMLLTGVLVHVIGKRQQTEKDCGYVR